MNSTSLSSTSDMKEDYNNKEWEVEQIIQERKKHIKNKKTGKTSDVTEYLVKWVGFKTPTWEPEENLENCKELLGKYLLSKELFNEEHEMKKSKKYVKINGKKRKYTNINENVDEIEEEPTKYSINSNSAVNKIKKYEEKKINNNHIINLTNMINEDNDEYEIELDEDDNDKIEEKKVDKDEKILVREDNVNIENKNIFSPAIDLGKTNDLTNKNGNESKIISIQGMKIPENSNEGISLKIKFRKNNETFVENLNTKTEEISYEHLAKYYEMFICDLFKGKEYSKEMEFGA